MKSLLLTISCLSMFAQNNAQALLASYSAVAAGSSLTLSHKSVGNCTNATTCSVTLSGSIATGDLIIILTSSKNADSVSSVSVGGTYVDGSVRSGLTGQNFFNRWLCLSGHIISRSM